MKEISNFFKGGIIIMLISNIFFTPKTIINFIKMYKTIYYKNEYKLNRKKIDTIIVSYSSNDDGGGESSTYNVYYYDKKKKLRFSADDVLMFY